MTEDRPALKLLLAAAGGLLFLSYGYTEMAGSDLWLHLAAGREIYEVGSPWLENRWSFPAGGGPHGVGPVSPSPSNNPVFPAGSDPHITHSLPASPPNSNNPRSCSRILSLLPISSTHSVCDK